jgi:phosphotransferase system enzyme I (PtsI)
VLHLIKATCDGAAAASEATGTTKPVGVCGEAAADPALAAVLVGLGVTTLSMSPRALPAVNRVLATITVDEAKQLAAAALAAPTAEAARDAVRASLPILDELGL